MEEDFWLLAFVADLPAFHPASGSEDSEFDRSVVSHEFRKDVSGLVADASSEVAPSFAS